MKEKSLKFNMVLNAIKGIMSIVFPLISFPYVSKILGVDNIGKYNFAGSIIGYFVLFSGLGIASYATREGARIREKKEEFNDFANEMFTINTIATVIAYIALGICIVFASKLQAYTVLLLIFSLQIVFKPIGIEWIYSIYEEYSYITIRSIVVQLISIIALFIFVKTEADVNNYAIITVAANGGANIVNYFHARKFCKLRLSKNIAWRKHMKPIMLLFATSIAISIYTTVDTTLLGFISGDYYVGLYAVAMKIYQIVKNILSAVLVVSIPRLSALLGKNDKVGYKGVASDIYRTLLTLVWPAVIGMILLREEIIIIISDATYLPAADSLAMLSVALIFCLGAWFWGQCVLVIHMREAVVLKATIVSGLINLVLSAVLIPIWNVNAAAFTTMVSEGISFVWCSVASRKYAKLEGIINVEVKILIGCLIMIAEILLLKKVLTDMVTFVIASVVVAAISYFVVEIILKNEAVYELKKSMLKKFMHKR